MTLLGVDHTCRQIAVPLQPKSDESLTGYLCRLADWNLINTPWELVRELSSWPTRQVDPEDRRRLAERVGCDPKLLDAMYKRSHGEDFDARLRTWRRRRVAPGSLRLSPHHRSVWQISPLPYCPESWDALIDTCPTCKQTLTWRTRAIERCQACDFDLRSADAALAEPGDRQELRMIAALLTGGRGYDAEMPGLDYLPARDLFELIVVLGRALKPGLGDGSPGFLSKQMLGGFRTLTALPSSIAALAKVDKNEPAHPFFTRLSLASRNRAEGPLKDAIESLRRPLPCDMGVIRLREARIAQGMATATDLAAELGIERAALRRLIEGGALGARQARGQDRAYDWFSSEDRQRLDALLKTKVRASTWAMHVGLAEVDVRQLLALGLLEEPEDEAVRRSSDGLQLDASRAAELKVKLAGVMVDADEDWLGVTEAFRAVGVGYKPWGLLLESALCGDLPHGLGRPAVGPFKLSKALLHPEAVEWLTGAATGARAIPAFSTEVFGDYRPKILTRGEVETILNCNPVDLSRLLQLGVLGARRPSCQRSFEASEVEEFAREHISSQELGALSNLAPRTVAIRLPKAGWPRLPSGFWRRRDLPQLLDAALKPVSSGA